MNANKFFNSSTLGNAGGFPFAEKLRPWTETSFEPPDWVEWEQGGDHEEFAAFLNRDFVLLRPPRAAFDGFTAVAMGGDDSAEDEGAAHLKTMFCQSHRFLMTYDWAGAFAGDRDFDDRGREFRLPAPNCCFDFFVSGGHVLALISEQAISADGSLAPFDGTDRFLLGVKLKSHNWILQGQSGARDGETQLFAFILKNIKAACVALEAEIAETEVIRAPHRLNAARERRGKLPISDYHIINLMPRQHAKLRLLDEPESHHRSLTELARRLRHERHVARMAEFHRR